MDEKTPMLDVEDLEVELFLQGLYQLYGYDFRHYSKAHMKRRIIHRMKRESMPSISYLQHELLHSPQCVPKILDDFSINVTEMYRNPDFFKFVRQEVVELLKQYPQINIWHAGCSSGQEVYSMAILLEEEGLLDRTTLYATDFNDKILKRAMEGVYPLETVNEYTRNYLEAGGKRQFSDYYSSHMNYITIEPWLRKHIKFINHNLVSDGVIDSMHMIVCRNVLIYFDKTLQERVVDLFTESLKGGGILALGSRESLQYTKASHYYKVWNEDLRVFHKLIN